MKIFFCGFMGSGKTYLMQDLKARSEQSLIFWDFLDLDDWLFQQLKSQDDRHLGESIERIGWDKFREIEKSSLLEILSWKKNVCVSLGGGALNSDVVKAIKEQIEALLVWVDTPFQICFKRIQGDPIRPLARKDEAQLSNIYLERLPLYQAAHIRVSELDHEMNGQNSLDLAQLVRKHVGSA